MRLVRKHALDDLAEAVRKALPVPLVDHLKKVLNRVAVENIHIDGIECRIDGQNRLTALLGTRLRMPARSLRSLPLRTLQAKLRRSAQKVALAAVGALPLAERKRSAQLRQFKVPDKLIRQNQPIAFPVAPVGGHQMLGQRLSGQDLLPAQVALHIVGICRVHPAAAKAAGPAVLVIDPDVKPQSAALLYGHFKGVHPRLAHIGDLQSGARMDKHAAHPFFLEIL